MIQIKKAVTGYGRRPTLKEITLSLQPGQVLGVVGVNGSGKTTLMRMIMGMLPLWRGLLYFDDQDFSGFGTEARVQAGLAMCPEGRMIFSSLTVEENLRIGAKVLVKRFGRTRARRETERGLEKSYAQFPVLKDRRNSMGGTLSGGQQQMLAISRALMSKPKTLLLDEPSLGLAPLIVDEVYGSMEKLRQEGGLSLVIVEESAYQVSGFADEIIVMKSGRVVLEGKALEVAQHPDLTKAYLS